MDIDPCKIRDSFGNLTLPPGGGKPGKINIPVQIRRFALCLLLFPSGPHKAGIPAAAHKTCKGQGNRKHGQIPFLSHFIRSFSFDRGCGRNRSLQI